jgi:hypothetical protein
VVIVVSRKIARHTIKLEERTHALTPDKMNRTARGRNLDNIEMPYPLSEEEATPTTPESEKNLLA